MSPPTYVWSFATPKSIAERRQNGECIWCEEPPDAVAAEPAGARRGSASGPGLICPEVGAGDVEALDRGIAVCL